MVANVANNASEMVPDRREEVTAGRFRERFKYPGIAFGLAVAAGPLELGIPPIVAGLFIAGAALPLWRRTIQRVTVQRRLDAELLDSLWILFHTVSGEVLAPALAILLTETGNTLRDATALAGHKRRPRLIRDRQFWIERKGRRRLVLSSDLTKGDRVFLAAGDRVPADGKAFGGEGILDQTALTGASRPIAAQAGTELYASTLLISGSLVLEVERVGADTQGARLLDTLQDKSSQDTRVSNYAGEMGNRAVAPALGASLLILAGTGNVHQALAPLQLDFAQGVGIAAPIPVLAGLQYAADNSVAIRGGQVLEQLARVDAVLFDKTGTLTERSSEIVEVDVTAGNLEADDLVSLAASACRYVLKPFAVALVKHAEAIGVSIKSSAHPSEQSDTLVVAEVDGQNVIVGTIHDLRDRGIHVDSDYHRKHKGVIQNRSIRYVARGTQLLGAVYYSNPLRPESATTIRTLQALGIHVYLVTGDSSQAANAAAYALGIRPGDTYAEASAEHKLAVLRSLQERHRAVAYVGDGVNDAPAMSYADVAISFRHASDVARETADVVLLDDDLRGVGFAIGVSRQAMGLIRESIVAVAAGNAAAVLGGVFWHMSPVASVVLNNGATVLAGLNGLRPLLAGPRQDPPIADHTIRDERGLLGVPWRKRQRSAVSQLLDGGSATQPA